MGNWLRATRRVFQDKEMLQDPGVRKEPFLGRFLVTVLRRRALLFPGELGR
jgi:hypothetical protein